MGVVGIVAARMAERYYRPAVVIAVNENGIGRGSARSIPEFDLFHGISQCRMHLDAFGGHQFAAGLTIRQENIPAFREAFTAIVHESMNGADPVPRINIDAEVDLGAITFGVVDELSTLGPFGAKNPEPLLAARQVRVSSARQVGQGHLSMKVRSDTGVTYDAIGFGMGGLLDDGTIDQGRIDMAFTLGRDSWRGEDRLRLQLVDVRPSESPSV
jgi:single-stranded-DNA-specific exonuclease